MAQNTGTGLEEIIFRALSKIIDPDLNKDIVALGFVKDLVLKKHLIGGTDVSFTIELTTPACPVKDEFKRSAQQVVHAIEGVRNVDVKMTAAVQKHSGSRPVIPGVRNVIAVGSGKGGVGKSTVAVNLAFALKETGSRVGLLDADIHGPSLGMMLGLSGMPEVKNSRILPMEAFGIPVMTFAFFAPVGDAVIWRGAMTSKAVSQMLFEVDWAQSVVNTENQELDYLIIDMPPGTGDIPLTLIHSVDVAGAVVVSTPQDVALLDASKGISMYEKMKVPMLGLVENMRGFVCPHCGQSTFIFGQGGAQAHAEKRAVPFLGAIPLDPLLVQRGDSGTPVMISDPKGPVSQAFRNVAARVAQQLSIAQFRSRETSGA